jgi:hypothetical protein
MTKSNPNKMFTFEFNENGTKEVSEQIMDSYNSGFIDQGETAVESENSNRTDN